MPDQPGPRTTVRSPGKELNKDLQAKVLRASAVQIALGEIIQENRAEIIKRAAAKLKAYGIEVTEEDIKVK